MKAKIIKNQDKAAVAVMAALVFSTLGTEALAWGAVGHRLVGSLAMRHLPADLPAFMRTQKAAEDMGELAREPDRWKGSGRTHDADRDAAHFVDLDDQGLANGVVALKELPDTREDYAALLRAKGEEVYKAGYLPYALIDGYQQLVSDFAYWRVLDAAYRAEKDPARKDWLYKDRARREYLIMRDLGVFAHYVGDGTQPMHLSIHYNGWGEKYSNPDGFTNEKVHSRFESQFVQENVTPNAVDAAMLPQAGCQGAPIKACVATFLTKSYERLVPYYQLEKDGGFKAGDKRGVDFATTQVALGASWLRDFTADAWKASEEVKIGWPAMAVKDLVAGKGKAYELLHGAE